MYVPSVICPGPIRLCPAHTDQKGVRATTDKSGISLVWVFCRRPRGGCLINLRTQKKQETGERGELRTENARHTTHNSCRHARYKRGRVANDDAKPSPLGYSGRSENESERAVFIIKYDRERRARGGSVVGGHCTAHDVTSEHSGESSSSGMTFGLLPGSAAVERMTPSSPPSTPPPPSAAVAAASFDVPTLPRWLRRCYDASCFSYLAAWAALLLHGLPRGACGRLLCALLPIQAGLSFMGDSHEFLSGKVLNGLWQTVDKVVPRLASHAPRDDTWPVRIGNCVSEPLGAVTANCWRGVRVVHVRHRRALRVAPRRRAAARPRPL